MAALLALLALAVAAGPAAAQPAPLPLRVASLSQWVVNLYRSTTALGQGLPRSLDAGVVDGVVFAWQDGRIPRSALVPKPIRVLAGPEAQAMGGRGAFTLVSVRPPAGEAAWTELAVRPETGQPGDVLVLEVGGELNTVFQVLARLFVLAPGGRLEELPLARRALFSSPGVPIIRQQFGVPPTLPRSVAFYGVPGQDFLVVRSPIETIVDGTVSTAGPADLSPYQGGEWREGDRVFVRVSLATLLAGAPPIVLAWKDRVPISDPDRRRPFDLLGP